MKSGESGLEPLWNSAQPATRTFDPKDIAHLPDAAQRYLAHSIFPGTPLASAVRLRMHGSIKLGRWRRFKAEQVIVRDRGMVWQASVRFLGATIRGYDRLVDGEGAMAWKLFGAISLMRASGPDVTRSAAGRLAAESIWIPSVLCDDRVRWRADGRGAVHARLAIDGHDAELALSLDRGRLQSIAMLRWGNPGGGRFEEVTFGAYVDQEATFDGYTIPVRLRAGWHFGDIGRFDREGMFFEAAIDDAVYR